MKDLILKIKRYLASRKRAYNVVFSVDSVDAVVVLEDLAQFCRAHQTTFHPNERVNVMLEGRREVWLRIQQHLELTPEQLWKIYGRKDLE